MRLGRLGAVALGLALAGCGDTTAKKEPGKPADNSAREGFTKGAAKLEELPANLKAVAEKELAGAKIQDVWKNLDKSGKLSSYEVRARVPESGKVKEVRIDLEGKVIEREGF